jgi:hypothetical protein
MKVLRSMAVSFALLLAGAILVPFAHAQSTFHRVTHVSFSGPVEIPGRVLPAGDYVIQLDVLPSNETSIVEIRDKNGENTIATLLTIPDYRMKPTGKTVILFRERAGNAPPALRAWFYPGENYGHEFAYPMHEAKMLAKANNTNVPAVADNTADNDLKGSKVSEATPNGDQAEVANNTPPASDTSDNNSNNAPAEAANNTPPAPANNQYQNAPAPQTNANTNNDGGNNLVASNQPLPKTASPVYLIALLGGLFLAVALTLGLFIGGRSEEERSL